MVTLEVMILGLVLDLSFHSSISLFEDIDKIHLVVDMVDIEDG